MDEELDDTLVTGAVPLEPEKARKPGAFFVGDPRINRAGMPKRAGTGAVPQLLRDLRHVYRRPKSKDKTQGQRMLRKLFEEKPDKFCYRLQKAEAEYQELSKQMQQPEKPEERQDLGHEKAMAALEKCLREKAWLKEQTT